MSTDTPQVVILGGPNGSGKSTSAPYLLRDELRVTEFVNADVIAQGLSAYSPESVAIEAGRLMLRRLDDLAAARADFAFETTLASRTFAPWLRKLIAEGYQVHLVFLWLPSPDLNIARVAERVRVGGHFVPDDTVRRRYAGGIRNFFSLYRPLATSWRFYDNGARRLRLIAEGSGQDVVKIADPALWGQLERQYGHAEGATDANG